MRPIFTKSLRTLPLLSQHGYVEALTVCLTLRPPLLQFTPQLISVIQEAQHIAESDDIAGMSKAPTHKTMQLYSSLRAASIDLLTAAMTCNETYKPEQTDLRNAVIGVFFKALTLRSKEIVAAAKKGLASVISQHRLPKELLQQSLRPILLNLADHRKLSVPLLQGLARLLELLTNCFNVTLGGRIGTSLFVFYLCFFLSHSFRIIEKLLEHLQKWTDPKPATKVWKEGEEVKIAAAIVDIFHLLPATAVRLLERLVTTTIQLEATLPREITSPYREPLARFFNRYPADTIAFFLDRLDQPSFGKLFVFILKSDFSPALRDELAKAPEKWVGRSFTPLSGLQFHGVQTIRILVRFLPDWLGQNRNVLDTLIEVWHSLVSNHLQLFLLSSNLN
jgi:transformation/transcription domain-associated protein